MCGVAAAHRADSTSSVQPKPAMAVGNPAVVIASSATWRISSTVAPASRARRTLDRTAPLRNGTDRDAQVHEPLGAVIERACIGNGFAQLIKRTRDRGIARSKFAVRNGQVFAHAGPPQSTTPPA